MTKNMHLFWKLASTALTVAAAREQAAHPTRPPSKKMSIARFFAILMANKK